MKPTSQVGSISAYLKKQKHVSQRLGDPLAAGTCRVARRGMAVTGPRETRDCVDASAEALSGRKVGGETATSERF